MNIEKLVEYVQSNYKESIGHSLSHTCRVFKNAMEIASHYDNIDIDALKVMVILHDIKRLEEDLDNSGNTDHAILGAIEAKKILLELGYTIDFANHVSDGIRTHRFRSSDNKPISIESKILFDADKLDIMGAVGIARMFMTAGSYNQEINNHMDIEEYTRMNIAENGRIKDDSKHCPIMEWKLKIKNIPSKMLTEYGKCIADQKYEYMSHFFEMLEQETSEYVIS